MAFWTQTGALSAIRIFDSSSPVEIGNNAGWSFGRTWAGSISEVAIFDRGLTVAEIQQSYNSAEAPPTIYVEPTVTPPVYEGETVTMTPGVSGALPLSYVWTENGGAIGGQTNRTLTLTSVTTGSSGTYALVVSNAYGAATSSPVVLSVIAGPPFIVQQPASVNLAAGGTAHFTVVAGGSTPYSYQWSLNNTPIAGATDATLVVSPIEPGDAGSYTVVVSNPHGSTNAGPAVLTLAAPPDIYAATIMALNPYAYWPLNDTNGGVCTDIASGLNGAFVGSPVTLGPGATNSGFGPSHMSYFTGVSGGGGAGFYVNCGTQVQLDQEANTIIAWEDTSTNGNHPAIVDKGDNTWRLQQSAPPGPTALGWSASR